MNLGIDKQLIRGSMCNVRILVTLYNVRQYKQNSVRPRGS